MSKCPECGKIFNPHSIHQIYCSEECGKAYRKIHGRFEREKITFNCAKCGRAVTTEPENGDKRSRFCCVQCERKYWRHPPADNPSTFKNFMSASEMLGYERWANEANY